MNYTIIPEKSARDAIRERNGVFKYCNDAHYNRILKKYNINLRLKPSKSERFGIVAKLFKVD